jgi:hypothetical protein
MALGIIMELRGTMQITMGGIMGMSWWKGYFIFFFF